MNKITLTPFIASTLILAFGILKYYSISKIKPEKSNVTELTELLSEGFSAFISRILSSILQLLLYFSVAIIIFSLVFQTPLHWQQIAAFILGGILMSLSTYLISKMGPLAIPKIISKSNNFLSDGLKVLNNTCGAIGFTVMGLIMLGLFSTLEFLGVKALVGYGLGIIYSAFFLRLGGGIFKTATDITEDSISELETDIPKFDRRNPATLLDIIGNFTGEIIGFSSDILSSFIFALISCFLLVFALSKSGTIDANVANKLFYLPIYVVSISLLVSIFTHIISNIRLKFSHQNFLLENLYASVLISGISTYAVLNLLQIPMTITPIWKELNHFYLFIAYLTGLIGAVLIGFTSEVLTSKRFRPVKYLASVAEFGPVISFFSGFSVGLRSNGLYLAYILFISLISLWVADFYGIAMAALGMLSCTSTLLVINFYKPLASITKKVTSLADVGSINEKNAQAMNRIGETTAALGNGFMSGAAALSAFSLFFSLILLAKIDHSQLLSIDLKLLCGIIIGIGFPILFSGYVLKGLVSATIAVIKEVSRQFREIPYLKEDKARPDMIKAADVTSVKAINALTLPGILMVVGPLLLGYIFGVKLLFGVVLGTILSGLNAGFYWANVGDSLNNAKRYIGQGYLGGKESSSFKNMAIADNIGDAFKDLLSPSINIVIKAISMIAILAILFLSLN